MDTNKIFDGLNDKQREAVECLEGPLLIMAGAGSGKTRVLTCRMANLLAHGVEPDRILAITFTNKAANEMKTRAESMIGDAARRVWLSTFHSFCAKLLRIEIDATGIRNRSFVIYDVSDSRSVIRKIIKDLNLDDKRFIPNYIHARISAAKNLLIDSKTFARGIKQNDEKAVFDNNVADIYTLYEERMKQNNALDFDDLLLIAVQLFQEYPEVLAKYQRKFQYVLIDEYQDTNVAQYRLTKLLAANHHNLCVVGDADQSIYAFRGADMRNILSFEKDYPEAHVVMLEQNYRSTQLILKAANAVIKNNKERKPKNLWTESEPGDKITFFEAANERAEAQRIAKEIENLIKQGYQYKSIALLYRTNAQSRNLEEALIKYDIPYLIVGGLKFYDRKEIKNIIAYLKLIYNRNDSLSMQRIINVPKRSIGNTSFDKLMDFAAKNGYAPFDVISDSGLLNLSGLTLRARQNLTEFAAFIKHCISMQSEMSLTGLVKYVLDESGYLKELKENDLPNGENEARIENLSQFVNVAKEFETDNPNATLEDFLNHIALISDIDELDKVKDRVSLMTIHAAKGLEFPIVFVSGLEEGLFPHSGSMLNEEQLEEERRACYVALTRAMQKLYLSSAATRSTFGKARTNELSRFVKEIPNECLTVYSQVRGGEGEETQGIRISSNPKNHQVTVASVRGAKIYDIKQMSAIKSEQPTPKIKPNVDVDWTIGDRVQHAKWGNGYVDDIQGQGKNRMLTIKFDDDKIGTKKLAVQFAPITKAN